METKQDIESLSLSLSLNWDRTVSVSVAAQPMNSWNPLVSASAGVPGGSMAMPSFWFSGVLGIQIQVFIIEQQGLSQIHKYVYLTYLFQIHKNFQNSLKI